MKTDHQGGNIQNQESEWHSPDDPVTDIKWALDGNYLNLVRTLLASNQVSSGPLRLGAQPQRSRGGWAPSRPSANLAQIKLIKLELKQKYRISVKLA